jgi:hypothetical protein
MVFYLSESFLENWEVDRRIWVLLLVLLGKSDRDCT